MVRKTAHTVTTAIHIATHCHPHLSQGYQLMSEKTYQILRDFYRPYNQDLLEIWPDADGSEWVNA